LSGGGCPPGLYLFRSLDKRVKTSSSLSGSQHAPSASSPAGTLQTAEPTMSEPLPTLKKIFDLEGEGQTNADGRSRQEELRRCVPGEPVELRRERDDRVDPNAITVLSERGVPIGRLTRHYAALLAPFLDRGRPHRAKLHCLRGGVPGYPNYGARISIAWEGRRELAHRPLDEAQERYRQRGGGSRATLPGEGALRPSGEAVAMLWGADRNTTLLALLCVILALGALAVYELANAIASACWACG
jgi:hypothetical protein